MSSSTVLSFSLPSPATTPATRKVLAAGRGFRRAGIVSNALSKRNVGRAIVDCSDADVIHAAPRGLPELAVTIAELHALDTDLIVIDGGDGTVRDVLTVGRAIWGATTPRICVLPSGKTNALSQDLGIPDHWTPAAAIHSAAICKSKRRAPIEVSEINGATPLQTGFLFGAGSFVDATDLAQSAHRAGAFNGAAVGLSLLWSIARTLFSTADSPWRSGSEMTTAYDEYATRMHGTTVDGNGMRYVLMASTLERLPLGLKPFGTARPGMKTLIIDAPPRVPLLNAATLLAGSQSDRLERDGYHRIDADFVRVHVPKGFILDGERYEGGTFDLRRGPEIMFLVP